MNIDIAIAYDNNYKEQAIVLMTSILANKSDETIKIHVIGENLDSADIELLKDFKNVEFNFYNVDNRIFDGYIIKDNYPVSILWKLIFPSIVNTEKLIYIDSDAVVKTSLKELWLTDLDDNYIAAVEDANGKKYTKKFGLNKDSKYFNSGIMLVNCKKWRENDICTKAVAIATYNSGTRLGFDQTILNKLFEHKVKFLDLKWNLQYCPINIWATYDDIKEYKEAITHPCIIHYVGDYKPWLSGLGCFNPKQHIYLKYHKMTNYVWMDYDWWKINDKLLFCRGIITFIKRYPLFFLRKNYWVNKLITPLRLKKCL